MATLRRLLIVDACVLIDFYDTDSSILKLASRHVGKIHIATPVFQEVKQLDESAAASLGLSIVDPGLELLSEASNRRGALSMQDWLCLLLAKQHGWTCVSNDARLRKACVDEKIDILWGLELIALLAETKALPKETAIKVGTKIQESNRFITARILQRFLQRVGKI